MVKKNEGPLLYIHQPFARTPVTKMQDVYTSKADGEDQNRTSKGFKQPDGYLENADSLLTENNPEQGESNKQDRNHGKGLNRVKPFKEMDVEERLQYLINFPKVLPPVPCIFHTSTENYQGILKEYKDNQIIIQNKDQTTNSFPISELKNITMSGIRSF